MLYEKKNDKKGFGYKFGYFCGYVLVVCIMAVAIASTLKFITWLF